MSRVFKRHPEIASEFRRENPTLRTNYMSFLLGMIETMCQSPQELSKDDMSSAYAAEKGKVSETRLQKMKDELKDLKMKCSNIEALVEKEKAKALDAKLRFSFDDVV
ncbi:unnamed protein product [Arabis nemorensis]|uniref:Uncharacterized protein n=1 Tax=Arabis nemorensis TaxID=586526 RepID=A0A565BRS0_9BRAS|nr:unnamed protein product [Arabis nemorensis]